MQTTCDLEDKVIKVNNLGVAETHPAYHEPHVDAISKQQPYIVACARSIADMEQQVTALIAKGYLPQGGIVYVNAYCYHQAMLLASLKL